MKPGDKFHIKGNVSEQEVLEDNGRLIRSKDCVSGEEELTPYHMVSDWPRCAQCGTPRKENELKSSVIHFRDRHPRGVGRNAGKAFCNQKTLSFCADKPCASHYQMGCEG